MTFWSSKGGVGKSTLTVNLAVAAAQAGWKVLTVDLDPQGNIADGLGYAEHERYDGGASLLEAAITRPDRLLVLDDVRPDLDLHCVPGGPESGPLADYVSSRSISSPTEMPWLIEQMLAPIADDYDLILFDLAPTPTALHNAALTAAHWIVVPTATDTFSRGGLTIGFKRYLEVRKGTNPDLEVIAGVISRHELRLAQELEEAITDLHDVFGDSIPVLLPPIRHNQLADGQMKKLGIAASEYAVMAKQLKRQRLAWLKQRKRDAIGAGDAPPNVSSVAAAMAADYDAVASQIIDMITDRLSVKTATRHEAVG